MTNRTSSELNTADYVEIDRICREFEQRLPAPDSLRISQLVEKHQEPFRGELLKQLVLTEIEICETQDVAIPNYFEIFSDDHELLYEVLRENRSELSAGVDNNAPGLPITMGDLVLVEEISRGAMGVVFRATQVDLRREVAVKMILSQHLASSEALQRFSLEAQAIARLDHPAIVPIYEIGEHDGQHFFTMKLIHGGNLSERLADFKVDDDGRSKSSIHKQQLRAANLVRQISNALSYAHQRGILHRDVKPTNILIDSDDRPYLSDFGLAKLMDAETSNLTLTSTVIGSPSYMAPEQAQGKNSDVTSAVDIYGLGAILYQLLTGRPPFVAPTIAETIRQVVSDPPKMVRKVNSNIHPDLETIALKCLEKEPSRRYHSAENVADELERFELGKPIQARAVTQVEQCWRWAARNPTLMGMLLALVFVTVLGVAGIAWNWRDARSERDAARWQAYRANMMTASSAFNLRQDDTLKSALGAAPMEYRNWEWHHFNCQLLKPILTLESTATQGEPIFFFFGPGDQLVNAVQRHHFSELYSSRWDINSGIDEHIIGNGVVSFDCQKFASVQKDGSVLVQDRINNNSTIIHTEFPAASVHGFSPHNEFVATGSAAKQGVFHIWDTDTGQLRFSIDGVPVGLHHYPFGPNSDRVVVPICQGDEGIWLYDLNNGIPIQKIDAVHSPKRLRAVAFSPDGQYLATGSNYPKNQIELWDSKTGAHVRSIGRHQNSVGVIRFTSDGKTLISGGRDRLVRIWDVATSKEKYVLRGHTEHVNDVVIDSRDEKIATASLDRTVRLWNLKTFELLNVFSTPETGLSRVAISATGSLVAGGEMGGKVHIWQPQVQQVLRGHQNFVYDLRISPDGKWIASCAWDGTVRIWEMATGEIFRKLDIVGHGKGLRFSRDGTQLVARTDRELAWFSFPECAEVHSRKLGSEQSIGMRSTFTSDGRFIVTPNQTKISIVDATTGKVTKSLAPSTKEPINEVCLSFDGRDIISGFGSKILVWDAETYELKHQVSGHTGEVFCLETSSDGRILASSSADFTVRFWNQDNYEEMVALPVPSYVYTMSFSPDGTRLATGCADGTIRLFDLKTHQEVVVLQGHSNFILGLEFSPDGKKLVSGSGDFTIRIWDGTPRE